MQVKINKSILEIVRGDITKQSTEAIVNAANQGLQGGGGVDGAIHRAGGPLIMKECRKIGRCPTGSAVITTAGNLKARYVIHTVGPVYRGGDKGEAELLKSAYLKSLRLASKIKIKSIAFSAISTGVYGYPLDEAARIALMTVVDYLNDKQDIELVRFILFNDNIFDIFKVELEKILN